MEINSNQPTTESHAGKFVMITDENFGLLKVGDLYSEHVFEMLLNYIFQDICDSRDVFRAKQRFIGLTELLQADPAFVETSPELFQKYLNLIIVLKLTALPLLDTQEVRKFFLETLLTSMQTAEVSVKEMTGSYLLWEGSAKNNISAVVDSVAENKELIGNTSLKIIGEDHDFSPIVKNWILDYNKSTAEVSKRGAMERITYFNQNVNVKQLAKEDKDLLLKVLEFYDWLRFGKQEIGAEMETAYVPRSSAERPRETAWPVDRQGSGGQATGVELDKRIGVVPGTPLKNQNMEYGMENRGETPSPLPNPPHQGEGIKGGNLPPTPPSRLEQRISELASGPASKNREYGIENRGSKKTR